MYITDLRSDFFSKLTHDYNQRVLILANLDVDSICAVKILLSLFQTEHVKYTLVPVQGRSALIKVQWFSEVPGSEIVDFRGITDILAIPKLKFSIKKVQSNGFLGVTDN